MHYPPQLVPPFYLSLTLWLAIVPCSIHSLPTVPSSLQGNLIQNLNKKFFHPPALEETIHEVQKILNQDPSLPRLTRGEIEELYEKVTREEYEKSVKAGDKVRADSMRALMLVLPYNTDNNTEENLQELFTRPPVTKVVDTYSSHQPIQFLTPSMNSDVKSNTNIVGQIDPTTYKPSFSLKRRTIPLKPTTYHPSNPPSVLYRMTTAVKETDFIPVKAPKPMQRFSSHYSAKNAEFLKVGAEKNKQTSTIKPVADILKSLGLMENTRTKSRVGLEDYYAAESAPKPSILSVADLRGMSLGPQIKLDAYSKFKPLNIGEEIRVKPEVEGYLTRFGIVGGRKRKAIKKNESSSTQNSLEPLSQESEIATAKVLSNHVKAKKGAPSIGNTELEKLLENLKELERLNANPPAVTAKTKPMTTSTTATPDSTTTATSLITNGKPLLIEPKKPRRRIDPNIDINFANKGNHQTEPKQTDELNKLLENLQELEKLEINPEKILKTTAAASKGTNTAASRNVAVETPAPTQASALTNRFSAPQALTPQQQLLLFQQQAQSGNTTPDLEQLQKVLQQLQVYEKNNAKTAPTTSTTTNKPKNAQTQIGPTNLWQLRKLLTDDSELEKLYEQAKARQQQSVKPNPSTTTSRTTTTSTTKKPTTSVADWLQLQRYLAQLEQATSRATTTPKTTTTTTTIMPRPAVIPQYLAHDYDDKPKKITMENLELQALINRVQQLERLNLQQKQVDKPRPTDVPLTQFLGFTTRNVKAPSEKQTDYRLPVNDFANLRTLYKQVEDAEKLSQGEIEISTKATAVKAYQEQQLETDNRKAQNFAQRIIDITNDTGSGSSLQEVAPNDFVHLQKLLSKVQELERVRIDMPTANPRQNINRETTKASNIDVAASQITQNVQQINGAHIVYPSKVNHKQLEDTLENSTQTEDLILDFPVYKSTTENPTRETKTKDLTSSEELKEVAYGHTSSEMEAYKNLQPPLIYKTVTKEPPRFVETKSPKEIKQGAKTNADLEEIQKLLNNAQELKKLGVSLSKELTQQLETKFSESDKRPTDSKKIPPTEIRKTHKKEPAGINEYLERFGLSNNAKITTQTEKSEVFIPTTASLAEEKLSERTAVFSLTTMKSLTPRPSKTTTESSVELPVFSATKIIEAAIKRAANRIGVATEGPKAFSRRDVNVDESKIDMMLGVGSDPDLMTDFSEINYQLSTPDGKPVTSSKMKDLQGDFSEMNYQVALQETKGPTNELQRAADRIGVATIRPKRFSRREDVNVGESKNNMMLGVDSAPDLMTDFSEFNYQFVTADGKPMTNSKMKDLQGDFSEINYQAALPESNGPKEQPVPDLTANVDELQRLIKNLQELKNLNLSSNDKALLRQADLKYLENFNKQQTVADDTIKSRRQSQEATERTTSNTESSTESNPMISTTDSARIQLDLSLDDSDTENGNGSSKDNTKIATSTTTTEETRNGSLTDLEDSFGPNPITESPPPPKKKNGFYFLADWNSFLEVGDGDDQVVVRLSPKIGDPRLFLPVKIP